MYTIVRAKKTGWKGLVSYTNVHKSLFKGCKVRKEKLNVPTEFLNEISCLTAFDRNMLICSEQKHCVRTQ